MISKLFRFLLIFLICSQAYSQTTDLSINIEAQDLSGAAISQINIYQNFQYLVTVSNSGNAVNDASISVSFDADLDITSTSSQNNTGGASDFSNIGINSNILTATIASMPNNGSVELLVEVIAPTNLGGIAANGIVSTPDGTTDTNTDNNQSIISIDVLDVVIDISVTHSQTQPTLGTSIDNWGDEVTYQFTITNNSTIDFPVGITQGKLMLSSSPDNGMPFASFISLECIGSTNGTLCPELSSLNTSFATVSGSTTDTASNIFSILSSFMITSGGSVSFEVVYQYSNYSCAENPSPMSVNSFIEINLNHNNVSSNTSNLVETNLLNPEQCPLTDACIETTIIDPVDTVNIEYGEQVTFETTVCNNGPSEVPMMFFLQNLSANVDWDIISINCLGTTGPVDCNDFFISDNGQLWVTNEFTLQPNTTITIETIVVFVEPPCNHLPHLVDASIKSQIVILPTQAVDINLDNNYFFNDLVLPAEEPCDIDDQDLQVTKTQISPQLPIGGSTSNTTEWGEITYEITVTNSGETDELIQVLDHMPVPSSSDVSISGTLINVECTGTTGTASCFDIQNANIGVTHDGITEDGSFDAFWEILPEDNWVLAANSSVTFTVTVNWEPQCSFQPIIGTNIVRVNYVNDNIVDASQGNNIASVNTFFAPCVDLVVQTYPEFSIVNTNDSFNWIVDVTNSVTSSDAVDVLFEDTLNSVFTITGTPTCTVTSGNATCSSSFSVSGNFISGIIPIMEAGSTVTINIPVSAPNFGGAFNNIAEAIPSPANNEELTPETNISINSVQVIGPRLEKSFTPETIIEGSESELTFTIYNTNSNPAQNNVSFTDNLPLGVILSGSPDWILSNGCTADFIGGIGDDFVGVENLVFPIGVESCTFSVMVTSDQIGTYLNNSQNFSNQNNIDTTQTSATLNVIEDTSNVDIGISKTVEPEMVSFGEEVNFTITATNWGTTAATLIEIIDMLPQGYEFVSADVSFGTFDNLSYTWHIPYLNANSSETLTLTAVVISSSNLTNVAILNSVNEPDRNDLNDEDSASVDISNCLIIPQGVSPNTDGDNDVLVIPCIEDYPDNVLKIYNRYGVQIYEASGYINTWDGTANMGVLKTSKTLPVGTYFYVLEIDGFAEPKVGYVYLNY